MWCIQMFSLYVSCWWELSSVNTSSLLWSCWRSRYGNPVLGCCRQRGRYGSPLSLLGCCRQRGRYGSPLLGCCLGKRCVFQSGRNPGFIYTPSLMLSPSPASPCPLVRLILQPWPFCPGGLWCTPPPWFSLNSPRLNPPWWPHPPWWWEIVSCNKGIQLVGELKKPTYLDHFGEIDLTLMAEEEELWLPAREKVWLMVEE